MASGLYLDKVLEQLRSSDDEGLDGAATAALADHPRWQALPVALQRHAADAALRIGCVRRAGDWSRVADAVADEYQRRKVAEGEAVGVIAAQSISERFTQSTLNSFHLAGSARSAAQMGIKRITELFDASKHVRQPLLRPVPADGREAVPGADT